MSALADKLQQLKIQKEQIKQEEIRLQKEIEEEEEKTRLLELDGTIDKLNLQINEIAKCIDGKIMPNNIHILHHQMQKDFKKDMNEFHLLLSNGILYGDELRKRKLILKEKEIDIKEGNGSNNGRNIKGYLVLNKDEYFITIKEFLDNLNKVDNETKEFFKNTHTSMQEGQFVELNPEQTSMNIIVPVFKTMMGIMKKQQEEINQLKKRKKKKKINK